MWPGILFSRTGLKFGYTNIFLLIKKNSFDVNISNTVIAVAVRRKHCMCLILALGVEKKMAIFDVLSVE